jgi:hypothetical protein
MDAVFGDRLEPLGLATGVLLVLAGAGTLVGLPWQTSETVLAGAVNVVGAVLVAVVGAALVWLTRRGGTAG